MIIQSKETKAQTSLIDLLGGNTKTSTTKSNDLFSKLLASFGMQSKTEDAKIVKSNDFKAIIDPKNIPTNAKTSATKELQTLLGGNEENGSAFISKELLGALSDDQVRTLIHRAKEYLKHEITAKNTEERIDLKSLPKTLAGLVQLAEKMGLEPQSITLSTIMEGSEKQTSFPSELLSKSLFDTKAMQLSKATEGSDPFGAIAQLLSEIKNKEVKNTSSTAHNDSPAEKKVAEASAQPLKSLLQTLEKRELLNEIPSSAEAKTSPASQLLKTETLVALLQGEGESKEGKHEALNGVKTEMDSSKSLQSLKADSIEVKSKEAAQSMRYFASDLKEAVQDYKPPFTRLTMTLNPEKLGEVEVTLVQRGNNVHVNIQSSNANSVAFLAHNATELKAQLAHQGITNATMNFMSGGEGQTNQQSQQQQQEHRPHSFRSYESFEELKLSEEQLSALEIIIPHYA
jgi:flagellar hook-length control protein FliK